jgi:hypothetical protein
MGGAGNQKPATRLGEDSAGQADPRRGGSGPGDGNRTTGCFVRLRRGPPDRLLPWGSCPLRRTPRADPAHPGLPHPAPSDHSVFTLSPACSLRAAPTRGLDAVLGVHPSGLVTSRSGAPVTGPLPSCRFRHSLPSPLRTRRSGGPPRLQGLVPTERPYPSGRSSLPSGPWPSWVTALLEALAPRRRPRLPGTSPHALSRRKRPKPPTTPALQGVDRCGVRRALASPPAPSRSDASSVRAGFRRSSLERR